MIRICASNHVQEHHAMVEVVTGLLYVGPEPADPHSHLGTANQRIRGQSGLSGASGLCGESDCLRG